MTPFFQWNIFQSWHVEPKVHYIVVSGPEDFYRVFEGIVCLFRVGGNVGKALYCSPDATCVVEKFVLSIPRPGHHTRRMVGLSYDLGLGTSADRENEIGSLSVYRSYLAVNKF